MTLHARWGILLALWLLAGVAQAGTHHHYYTDPQGTVLAKTDAQGNVIATYDYAPYGQAVAGMSGAPDGPGYTAHVNDPETGLVYMQARYYDPAVGRFLSVDPVTPSLGNTFNFNRYDYTSNNPINHIDPDGRCPDACIVEGGVVISASAVYVVATGLVAAGVCVTSCGKIIKSIDNAAHSVIQKITQHNVSDSGKRRKNRIPDKGEPGTTKENDAGTTKKKYGEDGWVEKEWNKGHGPDAPDGEKEDHVHDHKPNPNHPDGRPVRQPGRKPTPDDMLGF